MHYKKVDQRIQEFEEICRQEGIPVTMQRRVILEAVLKRKDHPTADQIYEEVQEQIPQLSRTTIYRVLDALVELGVIRRMQQTGGARFDGKVDRHHHLVCIRCGKIIDLEDTALDKLSVPRRKLKGFKIDNFSVHFSGICSDCQKEED